MLPAMDWHIAVHAGMTALQYACCLTICLGQLHCILDLLYSPVHRFHNVGSFVTSLSPPGPIPCALLSPECFKCGAGGLKKLHWKSMCGGNSTLHLQMQLYLLLLTCLFGSKPGASAQHPSTEQQTTLGKSPCAIAVNLSEIHKGRAFVTYGSP